VGELVRVAVVVGFGCTDVGILGELTAFLETGDPPDFLPPPPPPFAILFDMK